MVDEQLPDPTEAMTPEIKQAYVDWQKYGYFIVDSALLNEKIVIRSSSAEVLPKHKDLVSYTVSEALEMVEKATHPEDVIPIHQIKKRFQGTIERESDDDRAHPTKDISYPR
jgi:hypothetical protein